MEQSLHKQLKRLSLFWLKEKSIDLVANEVKFYVKRKKLIADAVGINFKKKEIRIIEVKTSKKDFERDILLQHDTFGYHNLAHYAYLLTPINLLDRKVIPSRYGLLECNQDGDVNVVKRPEKNAKPFIGFDTATKRTSRALTNAHLFKEADLSQTHFSENAKLHMITATCTSCKNREPYIINTSDEMLTCHKCGSEFPIIGSRAFFLSNFNEKFIQSVIERTQ